MFSGNLGYLVITAIRSKELLCSSHSAIADTTRGRSQGFPASLSGRNFRSCSQAGYKDLLFVLSSRGRSGERLHPCAYGTFLGLSAQSRQGYSSVERMSLHPIQGRRGGGVGGEDGRCKAMGRDGRVHVVCERERKGRRDGANSSRADV